MEIYMLAILIYAVSITAGYLIDKYLRIPWMLTAVLFGMTLSSFGLFSDVIQSADFQFLSKMGLLFFLFTIGIEIEMEQLRKLGRYIAVGQTLLTLTEGSLLAIFFYFAFPEFVSNSFIVALVCGIAFGTVGEVVLLAILEEFGLVKTRFGQLALGIGVADDIFEVLALSTIVILPAITFVGVSQSAAWSDLLTTILVLSGLVFITFLLSKTGKYTRRSLEKVKGDSFAIPFLIFMVLFSFVSFGLTGAEGMEIVAAIFSGIAIKQVLPEKFVEQYKKPIYFVANIFLGPFFFVSLGGKMSLSSLQSYPLLSFIIIAISLFSRISISYFLFNKLLGKRQSIIMGVGLDTKFSTSVVSEYILLTTGLIAAPLYTAIMAAYIILKPIIIVVFSRGLASIKDEVK
ncbi:MAG: cation:proton antiporter [Candidatus Bathyarchaeia archaeon]